VRATGVALHYTEFQAIPPLKFQRRNMRYSPPRMDALGRHRNNLPLVVDLREFLSGTYRCGLGTMTPNAAQQRASDLVHKRNNSTLFARGQQALFELVLQRAQIRCNTPNLLV